MSCEDFPCCGHGQNCCPDYDESGKQLNMKCTCGATVHIDNTSSICDDCLANQASSEYAETMSGFDDDYYNDDNDDNDDNDNDYYMYD